MGIVDNGEGCRCLGAGGIWEISVPSAQLCCKPNTAQTNTNSYKSNNNKHTPPCMIQDSIQRRERRPQFSWMALLCIQVGWLSSQSRVCFPSLPFAYSATNTWWAPTRNKAQGEERKIWRWTRHEHGLWRANGLSAQTQTGNFHAMDKVQWQGQQGHCGAQRGRAINPEGDKERGEGLPGRDLPQVSSWEMNWRLRKGSGTGLPGQPAGQRREWDAQVGGNWMCSGSYVRFGVTGDHCYMFTL